MDDPQYGDMIDFLGSLGTEQITHSGEKGFLAHLISVFSDLRRWGGDQDLCRAGMFHSIYGTEKFRRFCLPLDRRDDVRAVIGERAEWLSFLNCLMDRTPWDAIFVTQSDERTIRNRENGEVYPLSDDDFDAMATLQVCDWLEQVPRSQEWGYRRAAYRAMAEYLGGIAIEEYDRVFAGESQPA